MRFLKVNNRRRIRLAMSTVATRTRTLFATHSRTWRSTWLLLSSPRCPGCWLPSSTPYAGMLLALPTTHVHLRNRLADLSLSFFCSSDMCEHTEDTFVRVYWFILLALIFMLWKQISKALNVGYDLLRPFIGAQVDAALAELKGKVKLS